MNLKKLLFAVFCIGIPMVLLGATIRWYNDAGISQKTTMTGTEIFSMQQTGPNVYRWGYLNDIMRGWVATNDTRDIVLGGSLTSTNYRYFNAWTRLVFDGDSLTARAFAYPHYLTNELMAIEPYLLFGTNCAVSSATSLNVITNEVSNITPFIPSGGTNAIYCVWTGCNDAPSLPAATLFAQISNVWHTAKTNGFKVCAFTVTDNSYATSWPTNYHLRQYAVNDMIRRSTNWDYLIDVARLFHDVSSASIDGTHFTNDAARVIAVEVMKSLRSPYSKSWSIGSNSHTANLTVYRNQTNWGNLTVKGLESAEYTAADAGGKLITTRPALMFGGAVGYQFTTATTRYVPPNGTYGSVGTDTARQPASTIGAVQKLYVSINGTFGAGTNITFAVLTNGVSTGVTATIPGGSTSAFDASNISADCAAGTLLSVSFASNYNGTNATATYSWGFIYK